MLSILALASPLSGKAPPPTSLDTRDTLCDALAAAAQSNNFDATWAITVELGETARNSFGQETHRGTVRVVSRGAQLWGVVHWAPLAGMPASKHEILVRGDALPALSAAESGNERTISIAEFPSLGIVSDDLPLLAQTFRHIPSLLFPTLTQAIMVYPPEAVEVKADGQIVLRVLAIDGVAPEFDTALVLEPGLRPRLQSTRALAKVPQRPSDDEPVANGGEAHVTLWKRVGEMEIPARLERTNYAWFPNADKQEAQRTIYELTSSELASADPDRMVELSEWLKPKAAIADDRCGAVSCIGDDTLSLQGVRIRLRRPLLPADILASQSITSLCAAQEFPTLRGARTELPRALLSVAPATNTRLPSTPWALCAWTALAIGSVLWVATVIHSDRRFDDAHASTARRKPPRWMGLLAMSFIATGTGSLMWQRLGTSEAAPLFDLGSVRLTTGVGAIDGAVRFAAHDDNLRSIVKLIPSCPCLSAQLPRARGDQTREWTVPVRLQLSSSGEKRVHLTAMFDDGTHEIVHMKAIGITGEWGARPRLWPVVLIVEKQRAGVITALIQSSEGKVPSVDWRLPPDMTVDDITLRYLDPIDPHAEGWWEISTTLGRSAVEHRSLVGVAVLEVDGAQVASAFVLDGP